MKTKKIKNRSKYKIVALVAVLSLLLIWAGYTFLVSNKDVPGEQQAVEGQASVNEDGIDYSPPNKEDLEKNNQHKEELAKDEGKPGENTDDKKSVKPQITYAEVYGENVEVRSYVPNVLENNGTCKLILTKGGEKLEKTKEAVPNVSEMSCGLIKMSKSKLSTGNWKAVIEYTSSKAYGKSDSVVVGVN